MSMYVLYACMYGWMNVGKHVCIVCLYVCMYVCMTVCVHICLRVGR